MLFTKSFRYHLAQTGKLAGPIVAGQLAQITLMFTDTLMLGLYSSSALAAAALGNAIFYLFFSFGMGVSFGLKPLVAAHMARGEKADSRRLLWSGMLLYFILSVILVGIVLFSEPLYALMGQDEETMARMLPFLRLLAWSLIPFLLFMALSQFMEALSLTKLPMYVNFLGNASNIGLNYLLIFGVGPFPEQGAEGAALATLISRCLMFAVALLFFLFHRELRTYLVGEISFSIEKMKRLLKIGWPIGIQMSSETAAFAVTGVMVGWFGPVALASHQIAITISVVTYLSCAGLGQGTTVHVAHHFGLKGYHRLWEAGFAGIFISFVGMALAGILLFVFNETLPFFFVQLDDPNFDEVVALTATLLIGASLYQVPDGTQVVANGALRGIEDVKIPTYLTLFSYWGVAIPVSYFTGVVWGLEAIGIWVGLVGGLSVASVTLTWRYWWQTRRLSKQKRIA